MRRKTDFEASRDNIASLLLSLLFIAFGLALPYFISYIDAGLSQLKERADPSLLLAVIPAFILFAGNFTFLSIYLPIPHDLPAAVGILSIASILLGLLFLGLFRWFIRRNRRLRDARDRRIEKKYGGRRKMQ